MSVAPVTNDAASHASHRIGAAAAAAFTLREAADRWQGRSPCGSSGVKEMIVRASRRATQLRYPPAVARRKR
jgi:hypothetical protein